jgi:hypothetical protein
MDAPGIGYPPTTDPRVFHVTPVPANMPTSSAGGERLVAAMEHVDRVVSIFLEDIGRAVASVRAEVAAEREASLRAVDDAHEDAMRAAHQLVIDREGFERHRAQTESDLERRWADLRAEQEKDRRERARVEREIREMSQRATAETQAAALVQMQAAQATQVASLRAALGGDLGDPGNERYPTFDPTGLGAGFPVGHRGISGIDAPAFASFANGMVDFPSADGYYPMPHGFAAHSDLLPPGHGDGDGFDEDAFPGDPSRATSSRDASGANSEGPASVFAIGGLAKANAPLRTCEVYESARGAWRALPEMSTARGYLAVARGGSWTSSRGAPSSQPPTLLAIGGTDGRETLRSAEAFDFDLCTWRAIAPMRTPRIWLAAATVGRVTYAVGGYDGKEYLDVVEAFVPGPEDAAPNSAEALGRWERRSSLSSGRSTCGIAACGGILYCVGGFASPHYLSLSEAYDPAADRWWSVAPLSSPRRDLGACALEARRTLVCAGGYDGNAYVSIVEAFDPRTNVWRKLANLRTPRQLLGLTAKGDRIFAVGGFDGRQTSPVVEVYDARADRWTDGPPMAAPRLGLGVCCV